MLEGWAEGEKEAHRRVAWGAWHTEAFARTKRMPTLAKVLGVDQGVDNAQTLRANFERLVERQSGG